MPNTLPNRLPNSSITCHTPNRPSARPNRPKNTTSASLVVTTLKTLRNAKLQIGCRTRKGTIPPWIRLVRHKRKSITRNLHRTTIRHRTIHHCRTRTVINRPREARTPDSGPPYSRLKR
ncbi:hypothetical protein V6Z11_D02G016900 [Gossypium hirsutum]